MAYTNTPVYYDQLLTNFAVQYSAPGFIADRLMTTVPVTQPTGLFRTIDKANLLSVQSFETSEFGNPAELSASFGTATYKTAIYAAVERIPTSFERSTDVPGGLRMGAAQQIKAGLQGAQEYRVASLLQATGSYASANVTTLSGTSQWSDYTNSDPIPAIDALLPSLWLSPTCKKVMWMGLDVWVKLKNHPKVISRIGTAANTSTPAVVQQQLMATIFGVDEVLVGDQRGNFNNPGQTPTYSRFWGKHLGIVAVEPGAGSTMSLPFLAQYKYQDLVTQEWYAPLPGLSGVNMIKGAHQVGEQVVVNEAGILIANAVA